MELLNQLNEELWWYHNFFQPMMRLRQKIADGSSREDNRIKRIIDDGRTFRLALRQGALSPERQEHLVALRDFSAAIRNWITHRPIICFALCSRRNC